MHKDEIAAHDFFEELFSDLSETKITRNDLLKNKITLINENLDIYVKYKGKVCTARSIILELHDDIEKLIVDEIESEKNDYISCDIATSEMFALNLILSILEKLIENGAVNNQYLKKAVRQAIWRYTSNQIKTADAEIEFINSNRSYENVFNPEFIYETEFDTDLLNKYFKAEELTENEKRVLSFYIQLGCPSKIKQVDFANALNISKNSISKIFKRLKNERRKNNGRD